MLDDNSSSSSRHDSPIINSGSLTECGEAKETKHAQSPRPDEAFIRWLRERRMSAEEGAERDGMGKKRLGALATRLTASAVAAKAREVLSGPGRRKEAERRCKWFLLWNERRETRHRGGGGGQQLSLPEEEEGEDTISYGNNSSSNNNSSGSVSTTVPNLAYPPSFKLEVALYARTHSQYAASKIFAVARRRIFDWLRQLPRLRELQVRGQARKATGINFIHYQHFCWK